MWGMVMKEYVEPIVEVTLFTEDVVTASGERNVNYFDGTNMFDQEDKFTM